jgi:hypothetical protein
MADPKLVDVLFREAVSAIDAGDVSTLERLLTAHPELVNERLESPGAWLREKVGEALEGYFRRPYLLWFVAENPVRNDKLPANIAEVTRVILLAAQRHPAADLQEQLDYGLGLVCSGRVSRECGVQSELIDVLGDAGADANGALPSALAHRELAAAERLLQRGAKLTLLAAVCTGRADDVEHLARSASAAQRQAALAGAALYGQAPFLSILIDLGVDVSAYNPPGLHAHGTALHHAVDSGSLAAVQVLVEAGAALDTRDRIHQGTPLGWAEYLHRPEIADYLRGRGGR